MRLVGLWTQPADDGKIGEPPVVAPLVHVPTAHLADAGHGAEDDPARFEDAMQGPHRCLDVVNEHERLRENDAIKVFIRDLRRVRQVADNGRLRVALFDVHDMTGGEASRPEHAGVGIFAELQHPAADVVPMLGEKMLDVVSIDRSAPIKSEIAADGTDSTQIAHREVLALTSNRGDHRGRQNGLGHGRS